MSTISTQVFHEGELAVQQRVGAVAQGQNSGRMISDKIIPGAIKFIRKQPFVVIGSLDEIDNVWASIMVGQTGFMVADPQSVDIDVSQTIRADADPVWNNLAYNSRMGMLVVDLRRRARLRVNGRASFTPNEQQLHIDVEQAYPNCPQYIQRRNYRPDHTDAVSAESKTGTSLSDQQAALIADTDTLFIATHHPESGVDASHRGGNPGFIQLLSPTRLRVPDYIGNGMFNTLGNLSVNPQAGVVIPDFEHRRTLQLTGRAEILWDVDDPRNETGGTGRYWEFEIEQWVQIENSLPGAVEFLDYSPHNPKFVHPESSIPTSGEIS